MTDGWLVLLGMIIQGLLQYLFELVKIRKEKELKLFDYELELKKKYEGESISEFIRRVTKL